MLNDKTICIGVCTFRRLQLQDTLHSLSEINIPSGYKIKIIVADNDNKPSARALAEYCSAKFNLDIHYIHAPSSNISIARNACMKQAHQYSRWFVFIDDDEVAEADWLLCLLRTQQESNAQVVLGKITAAYPPEAPHWIKHLDLHSGAQPIPNRQGEIETGSTASAFIDLDFIKKHKLKFDIKLGKSGGEDTIFFRQLTLFGGKIAYSNRSGVMELVPATRATLRWLIKRRFRYGQTHARLLLMMRSTLTYKIKQNIIAMLKSIYCLSIAILFFWNPTKRYFWLIRSALHTGVVTGLLGMREISQYGK